MNGRTRKKIYNYLIRRDGPYCKCCGALASERPLVVDHKDNNNANNQEDNHQLMCRSCNYLKNPRRSERPVDKCVSEYENETVSELAVNREDEWQFRDYVYGRLEEQGEITEKDLLAAGAEVVGNSQVTCKRYLEKMCSSEGKCYRKKNRQHGGDTAKT